MPETTRRGEGSASDEPHPPSSEPQASEMVSRQCQSCGRDEPAADVVAVHRVYVTPESWDTEGKVEIVDEIEQWCFVCRSHYPHQEVGSATPEL